MTTETKLQETPNSKEAEMMVLGCMLTSNHSLSVVSESLSSKDFYFSEHGIIFKSLENLYKSDSQTDIHLVCEDLKRLNKLESVGGVAYLTTLAQYAGTSTYVEEYCKILQNKSYSRQQINLFSEAQKKLLNNPENPHALAETYRQKLLEIEKQYSPNDKASIGEILSGNKSRVDPTPIIDKLKE